MNIKMNRQLLIMLFNLTLIALLSSVISLEKSSKKIEPPSYMFSDLKSNNKSSDLSFLDKYSFVFPNKNNFSIKLNQNFSTGYIYQVKKMPKGISCLNCNQRLEGHRLINNDSNKSLRIRFGAPDYVLFEFNIDEKVYDYNSIGEIQIGYNARNKRDEDLQFGKITIALVNEKIYNKYLQNKKLNYLVNLYHR